MATYSFRTDEQDESNLEVLIREHKCYKVKRNTIFRAALEAFRCMQTWERNSYLRKIRSRDSRRVQRYG